MHEIKFSSTGCRNCEATVKLFEEEDAAQRVAIRLEKVTFMAAILGYDVMSTPDVVDGRVVQACGVPTRDKITQWLV